MESKPIEQYEVTPIVAAEKQEPMIDDESKRLAMAKAMIENQLSQREQLCAAEVKASIDSICKKHRCMMRFIEQRDIAENRTVGISIQPIAMERLQREQAAQ